MKRIAVLLGICSLAGCGPRVHHRDPPAGVVAPSERTPHLPAPSQDSALVPAPVRAIPQPKSTPDPAPETLLPDPGVTIDAVNGQLADAFFGYDQFDLSPSARQALDHDAALLRSILRDFPNLVVIVEGHCDERGSAEYNLALGDRRATRAIEFLTGLGLPAASFSPVSYGKEQPQCVEASDACRQLNRRAHLVVRGPAT